ncbi:RGL3 [Rhodococcus phage RGL3]|uniref:RGL3 n=1 Tax=Rhodococcus phage RGL3 TaxID=2922221 RepID=G9FHK5_9CAUD|nr:tail assembly chaperone [Rhodococcus phage RGL3]AEV52147.1 RGL3 [Rhodococcus phage RGL3]
MSNTYSLDQLKADLDKEFAPVVIQVDGEGLVLRNVLRCNDGERDTIFDLLAEFEALEESEKEDAATVRRSFELIRELLEVIVKDGKGKKLVDALGGDAALTMSVFNKWQTEAQVGGSLTLAKLIDEHGGALVADLRYFYGVDLRDAVREIPLYTPRYILELVRYLPTDSAYVAEKRGGQKYRGWDIRTYLQAASVNATREVGFITAQVNSKKRLTDPPLVETPDSEDREQRKRVEARQAPNAFAALAAAHAARVPKGAQ